MRQDQYNRPDSIRVKARANYKCQICGSEYGIQAHAPNGDHTNWKDGIALCANCHADQHPDLPRNLFTTKVHQPCWYNISARELARRFHCHTRTIIRRAKKLNIAFFQDISESDIQRIGTYSDNERITNIKEIGCSKCGSNKIWKYGYINNVSGKFRRYKCNNCGSTITDSQKLAR